MKNKLIEFFVFEHNLKCDNSDYCASDKRACDDLNNKKMIISIEVGIKSRMGIFLV